MRPWSRADLVQLAIGVVTGGVVVGLAWNGAATRSQLDDQTQYIVLGVAGFLVAVVAQSLWLKRGRRAVALYAATVQTTVASLVAEESPTGPSLAASSEGLVATGEMRHFHRPDCPIAVGQGWSTEPRRSHEAAGRTPCGICTP